MDKTGVAMGFRSGVAAEANGGEAMARCSGYPQRGAHRYDRNGPRPVAGPSESAGEGRLTCTSYVSRSFLYSMYLYGLWRTRRQAPRGTGTSRTLPVKRYSMP
jgi:hypothetical protein